MQQITLKDVERLLISKELKFYNFYNVDIDNAISLATQHYQNNLEDDPDKVEQNLHVVFSDIEVYQEDRNVKFDFNNSDHPISAVTLFDSKNNHYACFFLLRPINIDKFNSKPINEIENGFIQWMKEEGYLTDQTLKIYTFTKEEELIVETWKYIKQTNPLLLSGFNSDRFDYPYMYRRCIKLFGKENTPTIFSNYKFVEFRNGMMKIPDYPICDIQYLYRPRADGGLNFGKKLASFSLDFIAEEELKKKKLEYKEHQGDLNKFYEEDPHNYLLYNIIDVALCKMLNDKLKHIELLNTLRRIMKIPFSNALIGSSALFEGFTYHSLTTSNQKIRFGLVSQNAKTIEITQQKNIPKPITKKQDIDPINITQREYLSIITKFNGAYVKEPKAQIRKGTVIDLDATALYPSKIIESNIGFDSYRARIINPIIYKVLNQLEIHIGIKPMSPLIYNNIFQFINDFAEAKSVPSKLKYKRICYYTTGFLLNKLIEANVPMIKIYNPTTDYESYLLQFYLLPLLDIFNTVHPHRDVFNNFVYEYVFGNESDLASRYPILYIVNNTNSANQEILRLTTAETLEFISKYSLTICGTMFTKHQDYIGLFSNMLINMGEKRTGFRKLLKDYSPGSNEYNFYNSRQLAIKTAMNSSYGAYGLSTFRYSNHWLAESITSQGRLTLKLSQHLAEAYLKQQFG